MPEPLPETGVLANHSSDFILVKRTARQPAVHTDLFMEVAPQPKNTKIVMTVVPILFLLSLCAEV